MKSASLDIIYDEENQSSYKSIGVSVKEDGIETKKIFDSGDITVDFIDYIKWISSNTFDIVIHSSSWDHFFMDGDEIISIHIDHSDDNKVVVDHKEIMEKIDNLIEYPVPKNIKSFEELKAYYKEHKK